MKTKDEFIRRWKAHVAGIVALGSADVRSLIVGPFESARAFGNVMTGLGDTAEKLLKQLYDDLNPPEPPPPPAPKPAGMGKPEQPKK